MNDTVKLSPVEYVFKHLAATYGAAWDRSLGQAPIADVMTVWDYQLQPFTSTTNAKKMILWALENLPDRCPNVIEFKALCRRAPSAELPALPEPKANPARVAAEIAKLEPLKAARTSGPVDHKAWAKVLQKRHELGEKLNTNQIRCYRNALGLQVVV
jgi:hypothetical protein